jgi:nicotinamide riboside transporter PnuC
MTEIIGAVAGVLAVAGVVLNNRRLIWCFPVWFVSNGICCGLHAHAGLWSLAARDAVFLVLSGEGWFRWGRTSPQRRAEQ